MNLIIAGKWMFIPLKMVSIGIDPYPFCFAVYFSRNPVASSMSHRQSQRPQNMIFTFPVGKAGSGHTSAAFARAFAVAQKIQPLSSYFRLGSPQKVCPEVRDAPFQTTMGKMMIDH